jgi:hydroxypyruvate reductase
VIRNFNQLNESKQHEVVLNCLSEGISAAHPDTVVRDEISLVGSELSVCGTKYDLERFDEVVVLGAGKAAGTLGKELEFVLGSRIERGIIVTNNVTRTTCIDTRAGTHPVPDERCVAATHELLDLAREADEGTLVLFLVTGGGSSLLTAPRDGIELGDMQETVEETMSAGVPVGVLNTLRKHMSKVKGGQLAEVLAPGTVVGIVISDYIGNDLSVIASGPISPDPSTFEDALDAIESRNLSVPRAVEEHVRRGVAGEVPETPTTKRGSFDHVDVWIIADTMTAMRAAARHARSAGYEPMLLSSFTRGEAKDIGKAHVAIAEESIFTGHPVKPPAAIISGGEVVTTVDGDGRGGPNMELVTSACLELSSNRIVVGSIDTDGRDGGTDMAGAIGGTETVDSPRAARRALARNDTYHYLESQNSIIQTGQTETNVNDLRIMLVN